MLLGNLEAKRDWGYAQDYVEAMWLMMQQDKPEDYVIATGKAKTVREFVKLASKELGFNTIWKGSGLNEIGIDKNSGKTIIKIDSRHFRPLEVDNLQGDSAKAREKLGWQPKVHFQELVKIMVEEDWKSVKIEKNKNSSL